MRKVALALVVACAFSYSGPGCDTEEEDLVADRLGEPLCDVTAPDVEDPEEPMVRAALTTVDGCEELTERLRATLVEDMRRRVMESRCSILATDCYIPPEPIDLSIGCGMYASDAELYDSPERGDGGGGESASEYSTTNTQEAGVDEADFIKNDGQYIYAVTGGVLQIFRAWPAEETELLSWTQIAGTAQALYVFDDRAVIYSYDPTQTCYGSYNYDNYGYSTCGSQEATTLIAVYDISDRSEPRLERTIEMQGAYVNSRRVDGAVHSVVSFPGIQVAGLRYSPSRRPCDYESIEQVDQDLEDLVAENTRVIEAMRIDQVMPRVVDVRYGEDGTETVSDDLTGDCGGVLVPERLGGTGVLTVLSFDVSSAAAATATSIVGEQGIVYASPENLYVASIQNGGHGGDFETTTVHRFSMWSEPASTHYEASGRVGGRVLNQFAMGEHEGVLHMATTTGRLPSPEAFNSVYALRQDGGVLETVGVISPIARREDIRSARFVGDRGYVVTFKKTDPLFVLDLSDPEHPTVEGELHIPGYSTYMHMLDDTHLLTIGYDAQDEGDFAWFQGILLQIFDVSDMSDPRRIHNHVIGTRGTSSEAATNHLAFNYFGARDILAIPMVICEGGHDGSYGDEMTFDGLMVFDVTVEEGIEEHGRIAHQIDDRWGCGSWWTNSSSGVLRSIVMEDYVYSIASDEIIVARLDDLSTPVAHQTLASYPADDSGYDW